MGDFVDVDFLTSISRAHNFCAGAVQVSFLFLYKNSACI